MEQRAERNPESTIYVGNLSEKISEKILYELFLQAGPIANVYIPKDRVNQESQGYGFVEYVTEQDADYAVKVLNMIPVYGKPIRINKASSTQNRKDDVDIGATIFIGNLDPLVDDKLLYDTFSSFGKIIQLPKIVVNPDTGESKGYAFLSFDNFKSSDTAIEAMNGQFLINQPLNINYAFKKDGKGERYGSAVERLLAEQSAMLKSQNH